MIVQVIHVRRVLSVLIREMDSVVSVHHGKVIAPMVRENCDYYECTKQKFSLVAFNVGCTCKNGGRCMMGLGTYICECPYGYTGVNCETSKFLRIGNIRRLMQRGGEKEGVVFALLIHRSIVIELFLCRNEN